MKYLTLSKLLIQASINNENQLMALSGYIQQYFPDTGRSKESYIIFYQGGPIYHGTDVPGPVVQSSEESEYNSKCTAGMALAYFRILIHEFLNKDSHTVLQESPLIILDSNSDVCMANNGKDANHISHIPRRVHFVNNCLK